MRSACLVMTIILGLGVGISAAQSDEESALNSRLDEVYAALNNGDVEGYLLNYHEDAVYAIVNNVFVGHAGIETFESPSFANGIQIEYTITRPVFCLQRQPLLMATN